jgi:hypothetical protein
MLTTPKTQLEKDRDENNARAKRIATALHYAAVVMTHEHREYWALEDERLLPILNDNIQVTFARNEETLKAALALNAALDAFDDPELTNRAPVLPGRSDIGFSNGAFFIVPPPEPEPTPEPNPEPLPEP